MTSYKLQLVFTIVLINTVSISCKKYGSLSLVIDETASMRNEINVLKNEAYKLIDNNVGNKSNQFDDMVMVTFGDSGKPKVQVFQNNDKNEVKEVLGSIKVSGGGDCPEFSLSAIKAALNHSKPNSCLFVFTDASPKDGYVNHRRLYRKARWVLNATLQSKEISEVIELAQKKNSQIFFFITPSADVDLCREESHLFKPYWDIANATSGLAFKLNKKTDLETFLDFTKIAISEESQTAAKEISPNKTKDLKFDVNHRTEYFMVAVSAIGTKAELEVTKYGHNTEYHHYINRKMLIRGHSRIVWNADSKIERVLYPLPGKYIATVRGQSTTVIKVNYRKEFTFTHTFEKRVPPTFKNESIELIDGLKYVLLVKVSGLSNNYSIATAQIESIDGKIIYEKLNLTKVLESDDYYVTERFMPPSSTLFLVTIIGRCKITGRINVQTATTPNQSRKVEMSHIMIHGEKQYKYNSTFELTCHLNAYPKPEITWSNDEGVILPASSLEQKNETEYESKLLIKNFKTQDRFYCSVNYNGNTYKKSIDVKPITPFIIEEDDCPANITSTKITEIGSSTILYCNITSELPMGIEWYLLPEYKEVKNSSDFIILNDGRQITVKNVKEDTAGIYVCQATLKEDYKAKYVLERKVEIKRLPPYAGEKADEIVMENESLSIKCNVSKAYPKPHITWQFQEYGNNISHTLPQQGETLTISNATYNSAGFYKCKATNIMGNDEHLTEVTVLISPKISLLVNGKEETNITVEYADKNDTFLACKVISHPGVDIAWINERNASVAISNKTHCDLYYCVNILKLSQLIRSEKYYCRAVNNMDTIESDYISINVKSPFIVDSTNAIEFKNKTIEFGSSASLNCNITSKFPMKIDWYLDFEHKEVKNSSNYIVSNNGRQITINEINEDTSGKYICQATLTEDNTTKYELEMNVDIELSPPLAGIPENVEVTESEILSIKCNISKTYPIPYVTWQFQEYGSKSFRPLPQKGEVLTIHEVNYLSAGSYKCNATNMVGSDEHVTAVTVKFSPKFSKKILINGKAAMNITVEYADKNDTFVACEVISHPGVDIAWLNEKNASILKSHCDWYKCKSILKLSQLVRSEKYYCRAVNNMGTVESNYISINVKSPFIVDRSNATEFKNKTIEFGSPASLNCNITSKFPMKIDWYLDSEHKEVKNSSNYIVSNNGRQITINEINEDTSGKYICQATLTEDNTTKYELEMNVDIELSPPLAGKSENVEATENETLSIKCNISKTYPIPYVTWQFQEYGSKSFRPLPEKGEVLTIHEVNYLSAGSYKCNATNMMGSDEHVTAVTVKFLPKVKLLMNGKEETNVNVEFADKNETILTCTVISHAVTNISWFNGKHELIKSSNYSNSSNYVDVMELSQLKKSEKYYCRAENNVGTTTSSYVFVNVSSPFTIDRSNEFNDITKVNYGEKSLIKCGISSDLPMNITWQKGNVEIEKGSEDYSLLEDGAVLQVNHVGLDTEGNYTCKAFIVGNEQIQATHATTIEMTACFINLHSTTKKSPLVVEWPLGSWPGSLTTIGQHLSVNSNEELLLSCHNHSEKPNVFQNLPDESEIIATCEHGDKFKVGGKLYSLSELQCKTEVTPVVQETGEKCAYENTETVKVGYNVQTSEPTFLEIYTTCFDKTKKVPVYTKVNITEHDFSGVIEPVRQKYNKSHSEDNRRFCKEGSQCCLEKIQLVNQLDVMQESMKYATFIDGFNTVPYWRGCDGTGDNDSWAAIENNIRKNIRNPIVLSGAYDYINNNGTMIPRYLWKIIFTQRSQPRDIIVKVNDPSPTERDFRCKTACGVSWLKHKNVYCCHVKEFKKAFNIPIVDL